MRYTTQSAEQTYGLGQKIAANLRASAVIELIGDVGSGKTTLIKGLAVALGVREVVQSPTFSILARYETKAGSLHHYDFYRLEQPGLMAQALAESIAEEKAVTVIEWAASVADILPAKRVVIRLRPLSDNQRMIEIKGVKI